MQVYMEISLQNPVYNYHKLTKMFFFKKNDVQKKNRSCTSGSGEGIRKG
jgi:hypothetical protein